MERLFAMKKVIIIILAVVLVATVVGLGIFYLSSDKSGNSRVTNDEAEKDTKGRYLTIINDTNQIINQVHITVGDGSEIEHAFQKNPDEKSFSVEIPHDYDEYNVFTVTFIDRYEMKYQKAVTVTKEKGRTEVKITQDDYVKQDGDFKRKIDRFFNGD